MRLTIYMKSGNKISLPFIKNYKVNNRGDEVVGLEIERYRFAIGKRLLVGTIALSQIEAVTAS